jgi:hypothetical protein
LIIVDRKILELPKHVRLKVVAKAKSKSDLIVVFILILFGGYELLVFGCSTCLTDFSYNHSLLSALKKALK